MNFEIGHDGTLQVTALPHERVLADFFRSDVQRSEASCLYLIDVVDRAMGSGAETEFSTTGNAFEIQVSRQGVRIVPEYPDDDQYLPYELPLTEFRNVVQDCVEAIRAAQ